VILWNELCSSISLLEQLREGFVPSASLQTKLDMMSASPKRQIKDQHKRHKNIGNGMQK